MLLRITLLCVLTLTFCSCSSEPEDQKVNHRFLEDVQSYQSVELYEGLPHQNKEAATLEEELKKQKHIQLHGFPFYKNKIALKPEDLKVILDFYKEDSNFSPWGGHKKCGGYHPDWCIKFDNGKKTVHVQLCFGCWEMKVFSDNKLYHCDISPEAREALQILLKKYQKNRPPKSKR